MAGLISTGIWGFICSATMKAGKVTATFISGATGWIIKNNGDAEFKSIYARDKIVTNEYVYNRIRVTEDEEIVSTNGKILSAIDNGDGTFTVNLDLREGDINGFADGDLMQGYYHSPENSGVIYAVQRLTARADPNTDDQSMIVTCEAGNTPYPYMIIVRVGNTQNEERQAHIKISSRTNCMYFFDEIASWADMDNPDKVKCVLGKADIGLIPGWAVAAVGTIKKWFGLIADGVILRGTFILKSSGKTIETELDGVGQTIMEVETRFEIREGQISSKVTETKKYAESASGSATSSAGSATSASGSASAAAGSAAASEAAKVISVEKASEAKQTADGFQSTVTETTKKAVNDAVAGADAVIEEKVGTAVTQSAREWKVEVMGSDADGNPNKILAAINASKEGIKISGDKVQIDGTLLAQIIMASGLNINDKFVVTVNNGVAEVVVKGRVEADEGKFKGEINADSGAIGGFKIANGSLENKEEGDDNEMLLSRNLIRFLNQYTSLFIGADTYPTTGGGALATPIRIHINREMTNMSNGNVGLYLDVKGSQAYDDVEHSGNSALYIPNGRISGFRLRQRRLNTSQTLSKMDSFILSIASNPVTYTLPSNCEDGQIFVIKKHGTGGVTVSAGAGDAISETYDRRVQSTRFEKGYCLQFCYDLVNRSWWMVSWSDQWN